MTSLPRSFCSECKEVIEQGNAIYGLTGEHYDCAMMRMAEDRELGDEIVDKEWKPIPDKLEGKDANGWLAPDGQFYGCRSYVHIALGDEMAQYFKVGHRSSDLEKAGWGHVSDHGFHVRDSYISDKEPTQAQLDVLWDWFMSIRETLDEKVQAEKVLKWSFEHLFRKRME